MIDVHIIVRTVTNPKWVEQAIASIPTDICNIYIIDGADGTDTTTINRIKGFKKGTAKYVSFVDDDDYVLNGAFERCFKFLEDNPEIAAVGTRERRLFDDGSFEEFTLDELLPYEKGTELFEHMKWGKLHHLLILKREHVIPLLDKKEIYSSRRMIEGIKSSIAKAELKCELLDFVGYIWRIHANNTMNNRWTK